MLIYVKDMWIWVAAGLILGFLFIFSKRTITKKHQKSSKKETQWNINREVSNQHYEEEMEEEDGLMDEFLIMDLDEEE